MTDLTVTRPLPSPVGPLTLVASERGLRAVLWPVERPGRVRLDPAIEAPAGAEPVEADQQGAVAVLDRAQEELDRYFDGSLTAFSVPCEPRGSAFQREVWEALAALPWGTTTTYAALARQIGRPTAARAVGAAVGRNPLSIVVPCHRVVGRDGTLTGFAGGLEAKRWLLGHEGSLTPRLDLRA